MVAAVAPRFCGRCGAARVDLAAKFCGTCGAAYLGEGAATAAPTWEVADARRKRPLWLVALLTVGTLSFYLYALAGLTWKEMKRELRDGTMHPFWHAVAVAIPIYGLFRIHAHFRVLRQMQSAAGIQPSSSPGWMVVGFMLLWFLSSAAGNDTTPVWVTFAWLGLSGVLAVFVQANLDTYYDAVSNGAVASRIHWVEWLLLAASVIVVLLIWYTFFG